jgi:hypothetical protein
MWRSEYFMDRGNVLARFHLVRKRRISAQWIFDYNWRRCGFS